MKKILILFVIYSLPSIVFAQGWSLPSSSETIDPSQGAMASIWFQGTYVGPIDFDWENKPQKPSKPRVKVSYLRAAEVSTDEATGLTTLRWNDGSSYIGITNSGAMLVGTMTYADGSKYVGPWVRNMPNGNGTFQTPEGITYTVNFKDGLPHGKGVIQAPDGSLYTARWKDGTLKEKSIKPLEEK